MLSSSKSFTGDLLLGNKPEPNSPGGSSEASFAGLLLTFLGLTEGGILAEWNSRLADLQARSLETWRAQAVERAVNKLEDAMTPAAVRTPSATLWAWDGERYSRALAWPLH